MMNTLKLIDQGSPQLPQISAIEEALKLAQFVTKGDIFPQWKGRTHDAAVAILFGQSLGLSWGNSLLNIAVINGRPTVYGDALLGLCKKSPVWEDIDEKVDENTMVATCKVKRKGQTQQVRTYSIKDAERAGLLKKDNWIKNTPRMLQMRARAFALRDVFPDILQGLGCAEEVQDYPDSAKPKMVSKSDTNIVSFPASATLEMQPQSKTSLNLMKERLDEQRQHQKVRGIEAVERLKTLMPALQNGKGK